VEYFLKKHFTFSLSLIAVCSTSLVFCLLETIYSGTAISINSRTPYSSIILKGLKSLITNFIRLFVISLARLVLFDNLDGVCLKYGIKLFDVLGFVLEHC
jgi:hypothetical protein